MNIASRQKLIHTIVLFAIFFLLGYKYFNIAMVDYTATQLARFDDTLFTRDLVAAADSKTFTPKFFNDMLIVGLMRLGLTWPAALTVLYLIAVLILVSAIVFTVHEYFDKYRLCVGMVAITAVYFLTLGHAMGSNTLWEASFKMQTLSVAISFWSLYFALKKSPRWWAANGVLCIAALFSVQVALYFFLAVLVLMVLHILGYGVAPEMETISSTNDTRKVGSFAPLLSCTPFIVVGATYFGMVSLGTTSMLSNQQFIDFYVKLRNPHHLYPTAWDKTNVVMVFLATAALVLLVWRCCMYAGDRWKQQFAKIMRPTAIFLIIGVLLVLAMIVFSKVIPWAMPFKAYPSRFFIVLRVWMIGLLCGAMYRLLCNKEFVAVAFCVLCLATSSPIYTRDYTFLWILFLAGVVWTSQVIESKNVQGARVVSIIKNLALAGVGVLWSLM